MLRALWTSATGMEAQQLNIDVLANNLANVNTIGFKKSQADFQDLLYQTLLTPGATSAQGNQIPTGMQLGHGVRPVAIQKIFSQGDYQQTGHELDLAIEGEGFFQILQPNGELAYTRAGAFKLDSEGRIVTSDGYPLDPEMSIPPDASSITIGNDGTVSIVQGVGSEASELGTIQLVRFPNRAGLKAIGRNLFLPTTASGVAETGTPGEMGFGTIAQRYLEMSNVSVVDEMVNMIIAQRAYEVNTKAIQTADDMLQYANNIKR
jgi:flagellar basal-body rod protein FlgG